MSEQPLLQGPERPPAEGGAPDSLVVFLHGYGSNGEDLIALAEPLARLLPRTHFLSPDAVEPCPGAPNGRQWFALSTLARSERDEGVVRAGPVLDRWLDDQLARFGLPASRLALVGFSQGTMMALHVGLRRAEPVAGILGFSGALARIPRLMDELRVRPPVRLVHGDQDPVVPVWMMFEAFGALEALKVPVDWHVSRGTPHSIAPDGLKAGGEFLARVLA